MEKKLLLLLLYITVLLLIKNENLMKVQENRGFYIDIIDSHQEELLESTYCVREGDSSLVLIPPFS